MDLTSFPSQLAEKLGINLFAGQILASSIFLTLFLFPTLLLSWRNPVFPCLVVSFVTLGFCVAMQWLPIWIFLVTSLTIALLFSGRIRDWISGA